MRELALVSLKRFSLLPGNVDFAGGSNNSITPEKKVKKAVRDQAKSLKAEQTSIFEGDLINEDFENSTEQFEEIEDNLTEEQENVQVAQVESNGGESKNQELTLAQAVEKGKKILFEIENSTALLYEGYFANRGFAYTAKQVVVNFEEYLQALLLVSVMEGRDLQEDEMRFIWSVLSHADIFTGMDSIEQTLERAKKMIDVVPHAVLISVAVDKFYDKNETASIVNSIYALYLLACKLAGIKPALKEKLLAKIIQFAQAQGVKL